MDEKNKDKIVALVNAYAQGKRTPFKNVDDCMTEMVKHTPFGILKNCSGEYAPILKYNHGGISVISGCDEIIVETWANALEDYTFVDDTPFGIKEHIENNKTEQKIENNDSRMARI